MESLTDIRVRYAETDAMGIVHHAAYVVWIELGRSDLLRSLGSGYTEWERRGVHMTVAGIEMSYRAPSRYDELILVRDIPFQSLCMHHVLPFHGVAHIAYLPDERILGLSKLARVVDLFARDLQLQERLTTQVGSWLQQQLQPKGVSLKCFHLME